MEPLYRNLVSRDKINKLVYLSRVLYLCCTRSCFPVKGFFVIIPPPLQVVIMDLATVVRLLGTTSDSRPLFSTQLWTCEKAMKKIYLFLSEYAKNWYVKYRIRPRQAWVQRSFCDQCKYNFKPVY